MKHGRSIIAPVLVLGIAVITGGWFLQRGVEAQDNVYLQMRTFQEVLDHVERRFVESVDKTEVYDAASAASAWNRILAFLRAELE